MTSVNKIVAENKIKVRYYTDGDDYPFVVQENSLIDGSLSWYDCYCVVGQHFELKDPEYLNTCVEIFVKEYKELTEGFYTPDEYL